VPRTRARRARAPFFPWFAAALLRIADMNQPTAQRRHSRPVERQESLIWDYFEQRNNGFFVEVGANHPTTGSLTWFFAQRGWRGILIEPERRFLELLRENRPESTVFGVACSSAEKTGYADLHIPPESLNGFATLDPNAEDCRIEYQRKERVRVVTLDWIVAEAGNPQIDLVIIDTEGTELDVLRGFSLSVHQPALLVIEDKVQSLDKHRYLRQNRYRLVKRTELNNWYIPQAIPFTMTSFFERCRLYRKVFLGLPFRKLRHWRHACRVAPLH
jgi:FkbM family methyltransferase